MWSAQSTHKGYFNRREHMMIDEHTLEQLTRTVHLAALRAGQVIRERYDKPREVRQKTGPRDLVTDTDQAAQDAALEVIRQRHPEHVILAEESPDNLGEEGERQHITDGAVWLIDPVDGTTNFVMGLPMFCVSVGVAVNGEPTVGAIYDPMREELFMGVRGQGATLNGWPLEALTYTSLALSVISVDWSHDPDKRDLALKYVMALAPRCRTVRGLGSTALALAYIACGRVQVYFNLGAKPWDVGAGAAIIREVGGEFTCPDGRAWHLGEPALVAGHPALLEDVLPLMQRSISSSQA